MGPLCYCLHLSTAKRGTYSENVVMTASGWVRVWVSTLPRHNIGRDNFIALHNCTPLSLEQRRLKQLLCLMFIFKGRHEDTPREHARNTRGANVYSFVRE